MANDTAKRLLARVKEFREARGLSQEAFAEKAGIGYKYYQHVESGRRRDIRLSTLIKIAGGLGLTLSELVDFETAVAESPANYEAKSAKRLKTTRAASLRRANPKHT